MREQKESRLDLKTEEAALKYAALLQKTELFKSDSEEQLIRMLCVLRARFQAAEKGEMLHEAGLPLLSFGVVLYGAVQALMDDLDGRRMIMAGVGPGGFFGESLAFLKVQNAPVYIMARETSGVLWLSPKLFDSADSDPLTRELKRRFTAMLATRALRMNDRIQILSKLSLRDKLITYFTELSRTQKSRVLEIPFDREDMAAYIGTNRSALSRELSRMKKEGLIDYYRNSVRILTRCGCNGLFRDF